MKLATLDKFSRKAAYQAVLAMKQDDRVPPGKQLDKLLNFFAPALPKKAKSAEQGVGMACGIKDVREFTHYIHVKNGIATATDGHRMHWADTYLPDGTYDPKTQLRVDYKGTLPDLDRVKAPFNAPNSCRTVEAEPCLSSPGTKTKPFQFVKFTNGGAVRADYLKAATNGKDLTVFVDSVNAENGCTGNSEYGKFRIMGVRV